MILRLTLENPRWGYAKIESELVKLGFDASRTTIYHVLKRDEAEPARVRSGFISWHQLMTHSKEQILACGFFTVGTIWLRIL